VTPLTLSAMQYCGVPYIWGGQNAFTGFDCSGLVLTCLHDLGITLPDMTSSDIYKWCKKQDEFYECKPEEDCLLFFGKDKITHIAIAINQKQMIETGGGGRDFKEFDLNLHKRNDARVRVKLISRRKDLLHCLKIFY
jgi:cell wall-associated NlpC family hydrolase